MINVKHKCQVKLASVQDGKTRNSASKYVGKSHDMVTCMFMQINGIVLTNDETITQQIKCME